VVGVNAGVILLLCTAIQTSKRPARVRIRLGSFLGFGA